MIRAAVLFALSSLLLYAQNSAGCATENPSAAIREILGGRAPAALTKDVLTAALADPRAEVRSLAAQMLARSTDKTVLAPLTRARAVETDECIKTGMQMKLSLLVSELSYDPGLHPGGQKWIAPFQSCASSPSPSVKLTLEPIAGQPSTVRLVARNLTEQPLFLVQAPPQELFSVTVLDPSGAPARIASQQEAFYRPAPALAVAVGHSSAGVPLAPQEDVPLWTWRVGDDFDMSAPGTYQVSLGGRIDYLDTTICSNTAQVTVGN